MDLDHVVVAVLTELRTQLDEARHELRTERGKNRDLTIQSEVQNKKIAELHAAVPHHRAVGYISALYDSGAREFSVKAKVYDDYEQGLVVNERFLMRAPDDGKCLAFKDAKVRRAS